MKKLLAALDQFVNTRLKGPKDAFLKFYTVREEREKKMMLVLGVAFFLFADYWVLISPVVTAFTKKMPEIAESRRVLDGLKDDIKNEKTLRENADSIIERAKSSEAKFIAPAEVPKLLEDLSRMARDSGVKILSVEPREVVHTRAMEPYGRIPIRISAMAGFHDLGRFVASLENARTYFKVANLKIGINDSDPKRQMVELELQAYRKG